MADSKEEIMLADIIAKEAETAFNEIIGKYPEKSFYGFSVYTDESATGVDIAVNSLEYYSESVSEVRNKRRQVIASFEHKWYSIEWEFEGGFASSFEETRAQIGAIFSANTETEAVAKVIQAMSDALSILDNKGLFSQKVNRENVILCISAPDAEYNEEIFERSIQDLNPAEVIEKYSSEKDAAYSN